MVSTPYAPDGLFDSIEKDQKNHAFTNVFCLTIPMALTKSIQEKIQEI
jgi:hypothetical protein